MEISRIAACNIGDFQKAAGQAQTSLNYRAMQNQWFGAFREASACRLSDSIEILWLKDDDHDFRPCKSVVGPTSRDHLPAIADAVAAWTTQLPA